MGIPGKSGQRMSRLPPHCVILDKAITDIASFFGQWKQTLRRDGGAGREGIVDYLHIHLLWHHFLWYYYPEWIRKLYIISLLFHYFQITVIFNEVKISLPALPNFTLYGKKKAFTFLLCLKVDISYSPPVNKILLNSLKVKILL